MNKSNRISFGDSEFLPRKWEVVSPCAILLTLHTYFWYELYSNCIFIFIHLATPKAGMILGGLLLLHHRLHPNSKLQRQKEQGQESDAELHFEFF